MLFDDENYIALETKGICALLRLGKSFFLCIVSALFRRLRYILGCLFAFLNTEGNERRKIDRNEFLILDQLQLPFFIRFIHVTW
jgi:hypothetical protein